MNLLHMLLFPAGLCYLLAWGFGFFHSRKKPGGARYFYIFSVLGFVLQSAALGYLAFKTGRLPIGNSYELTESVAWAIVLVDCAASAILGARVAGSMALFVAAILAILPPCCPSFSACVFESAPALKPDLAAVHGAFAVLSYAFLCLCAMFSGVYLFQIRALKRRSGDLLSGDFLPLPKILRFARRSLGLACLGMALSVFVGVLAASSADGSFFMLLKFSAGGVLFLAMLGLLWLSFRRDLNGRTFARLSLILFALSILILIPIELRNVKIL